MRRRERVLLASVIAAFVLAIAAGCSLSWEVRPDPGDGSAAPETSLPDVHVPDTGLDAPDDVATDVDVPDADPCDGLRAALVRAKANAKKCAFPSSTQCKVTVKDECDCDVIVATAASSETTSYSDAVAAFLGASCAHVPACEPLCPALGAMTAWSCVSTNACLP